MNNNLIAIIVTYNGAQWIEHCINSILASTIKSDIFVIDNHSIDETVSLIEKYNSVIKLIKLDKNLGFGKANNIGLRYAIEKDYEYAYLLNQDAWVLPDTFEKLIDIHKRNSIYGIISPFQMYPDKQHVEFGFDDLVCKRIYSNLYQDLYFNRLPNLYELEFVQAAHWLISKECLQTVGMFSPIFPHYGEDDNYCQRVKYHGFKIGLAPKVIGIHDSAAKAPVDKKKINYRIYLSYIQEMSNINYSIRDVLYHMTIDSFFQCKRQKSIKPFLLLIKALTRYREIKRYKKLSLQRCAFLEDSPKHNFTDLDNIYGSDYYNTGN